MCLNLLSNHMYPCIQDPQTELVPFHPSVLFSKHHAWETNHGSWLILSWFRTDMEKNKQKINFLIKKGICGCKGSQKNLPFYQFRYRHLRVSCRWWKFSNLACRVVTIPNFNSTVRFPPYTIWFFHFIINWWNWNAIKVENKILSLFKMFHFMLKNRLLLLRGWTLGLTELVARGDPMVKS